MNEMICWFLWGICGVFVGVSVGQYNDQATELKYACEKDLARSKECVMLFINPDKGDENNG